MPKAKCKHHSVMPVFAESAVCVECGKPVCRACRGQSSRPDLPVDEICNVFYWRHAIETNAWHGRALSREDAVNALNSAKLLCDFRSARSLAKS